MITKVRKIGNSSGIIIPRVFLKELGSPAVVDVALLEREIIISPVAEKIVRRKLRDEDESAGLSILASAKLKRSLETGKIRWTGAREMERKIEI